MFFDVDKLEQKQTADKVNIRIAFGEKLMISYVNIEANATLDEHSHPHEQMGLFLEGEAEFTIGDETQHMKPGMGFLVPPNVKHKVVTSDQPIVVLDIFSPPREDFK